MKGSIEDAIIFVPMIALIVAAGSGSRMQQDIPKQYLPLKGQPVLYYTLRAFLNFHPEMKIMLVAQPDHETYLKPILSMFPGRSIQVTPGGETRFHSVQNGLNLIEENEVVFIHDAARPFISEALLERCYQETLLHGHAIPAISVKDSFRIQNDRGYQQINRDLLKAIQTPQTFQASLIKKAYQLALGGSFTDDASVLELLQPSIHLVEGDEQNLKLTTPMDWHWAECIMSAEAPFSTAF